MSNCLPQNYADKSDVMRIAIVLPELLPVPPVKGGAVEHWVHEATRRVPGANYQLTVFSRPADVPGHVGVTYVAVPWGPISRFCYAIKQRLAGLKAVRGLAKLQNVLVYALCVRSALDAFDVVCIENEPNIVTFLKRRADQKLVLHMHNDHLSSPALRSHYRRQLEKVDRVIFCSRFLMVQATIAFPEFSGKFATFLNVTDTTFFYPVDKIAARRRFNIHGPLDPLLVYAGRLVPEKGVHVLIAAFLRLHAHHPNARLVVAGGSFFAASGQWQTPYQRELCALARPVSQSIEFLGHMPHTEIRELYSAADVVVVPSVWEEPFGLVVIEAMACGAAVVGTNVGGIPEIIDDGKDGCLVEPGNPSELFEALMRLLADGEQARLIGEAARRKVEKQFSWDANAGAFWAQLGESA